MSQQAQQSASAAQDAQKATEAASVSAERNAQAAADSENAAESSAAAALQSQNLAQGFAGNAQDSANVASAAEANAAASASASKRSENNTAQSEEKAADSAKSAVLSAGEAAESARAAAHGAEEASGSATLSESWAVGGTGTRDGEDYNNAKYWAQLAQTVAQGAQGYYVTASALKEAHPTGQNGWWAIVGETDTIWIWDSDSGEWVDSSTTIDMSNYYTKSESDERYATAAQGTLASTAVQPNDLAPYAKTADLPTAPSDIGAATAAQGAKADTAVQSVNGKAGTAITLAAADVDAATAAQGAKADTAVQSVNGKTPDVNGNVEVAKVFGMIGVKDSPINSGTVITFGVVPKAGDILFIKVLYRQFYTTHFTLFSESGVETLAVYPGSSGSNIAYMNLQFATAGIYIAGLYTAGGGNAPDISRIEVYLIR